MRIKSRPALLVVSLTLVAAASQATLAQQIPIDATRITRPVMGDANNYRTANGAPALAVSDPLLRAAQQYAEYLARTNTSGHSADGRTVEQRILATNAYKPCFHAENVYQHSSWPNPANPSLIADAAMQSWKNSPGHDANLRDPRARHIGVGAAAWTHAGRHYYKVVQLFASDCGESRPSVATCKLGYVWRVARPSDLVCVTPQSRARVAQENRIAAQRVQPGGGAYGPNTCLPGFVWREAFNGDGVCVTPQVRARVRMENQLAASRTL